MKKITIIAWEAMLMMILKKIKHSPQELQKEIHPTVFFTGQIQRLMIKNIEFQYPIDVSPDPAFELFQKNTINMWLTELAYEINDENAVVEYRINKNGKNHITFRNISPR